MVAAFNLDSLSTYLPNLVLKQQDPTSPLEAYNIHVTFENSIEKILITPETDTEDLTRVLFAVCGLLLEDAEGVELSLWADGAQVVGELLENSVETLYTIKLSSVLQEDTLKPLFNQIKQITAKLAAMDMDKLVCDGSVYAPVPDHSDYIEKYKFTQSVKDALKTPMFNNWEYEDNELVALLIHMYVEMDIPEYFNIDMQVLYNFVSKVRDHYNFNPFHCFKHGFCVTQMAYAVVHQSGIIDEMTMLERLVLFTACLGHDLDHPGYNNAYQVNAKTDLAIIYNDAAPLENHHSAMLFSILQLDSSNILKKLDRQALGIVRKGIIRCIMATDMAKHGEHLQAYNKIIPTFSLQDGEHRAQVLCMIIKCSDISTEVRPPHIADVWVNRLLEEFFSQSDREKAEGLPFLPFMDRDKVTKPGAQVGFLSFVVIPLYEAFAKLYPQIEPQFIQPIKKSLDYYKGLQAIEKK